MLSGVGPASTLDEFKIPIVADVAGVGQNMWVSFVMGYQFGSHH